MGEEETPADMFGGLRAGVGIATALSTRHASQSPSRTLPPAFVFRSRLHNASRSIVRRKVVPSPSLACSLVVNTGTASTFPPALIRCARIMSVASRSPMTRIRGRGRGVVEEAAEGARRRGRASERPRGDQTMLPLDEEGERKYEVAALTQAGPGFGVGCTSTGTSSRRETDSAYRARRGRKCELSVVPEQVRHAVLAHLQ